MESVIYGLWCLCHPTDGVRYVGQTRVSAQRRYNAHLQNAGYTDFPVNRWVLKHGRENIGYSILEVCLPDELDDREQKWIRELKNSNRLVNVADGGMSNRSRSWTPEQHKKIQDAWTPEARAAASSRILERFKTGWHPRHGLTLSDEHRAKLSAGAAARRGSGNPNFGVKYSENRKHRMSRARAQLTEDQVITIRQYRIAGRSLTRLAKQIGLGQPTVWKIAVGERYKWVPMVEGPLLDRAR